MLTRRAELELCEEVIEGYLTPPGKAGKALAEIKGRKLHDCRSWAEYLRERWGKRDTWADKLLHTHQMEEELGGQMSTAQAALLRRAPKEVRAKVWEAVRCEAALSGERISLSTMEDLVEELSHE